MLNIAGPEYDFGHVVHAVIQECEHRRRALEPEDTDEQLMSIARDKLQRIKAAYDEFGGSATYWSALQTEVLDTAMPQYSKAAIEMNRLERNGWDVFRHGDPAARGLFALIGLFIGSLIIATPFIPIVESLFAFGLTGAGFLYPDIARYVHERRHSHMLNRLVADSARYQQSARLHYMTTTQIRDSFSISSAPAIEGDLETSGHADEQPTTREIPRPHSE